MSPLASDGLTAPDGTWGMPLWARLLLVAAALGLFAFRFQDRELVPYVLDEPQLQDAAQADAHAGRWARISVLRGTQGVRYGPAPLWFYTAVHRVAGPLPERSILATTLLLTLAQLGLALAVARALGGGAVLFATLAALLASSPYLFFWSRSGWDNPLLGAFVAGAVAVLLLERLPALVRGALLGVLLGLGLSTHLMAIPFSLALLAVLGLEGLRQHAARRTLGALLVTALTVSLPYLGALRREPKAPVQAWEMWGGPSAALGRLSAALLGPGQVSTASGVDGLLDAAATLFRRSVGGWRLLLDAGPALALVLSVLAATGLLAAAWKGNAPARRLGRLGLLAWAGHALFLALPDLHLEPHYQQPTAWLVPVGCCALLMALLPRRTLAAWLLLGGLWAVALADVGFTEAWVGWLREAGGTAGSHYSVPLAAQRAALREACTTGRSGVAFANRTALFAASLRSLAGTEPACAHKRLGLCNGDCPPLDANWRVFPLRYAAPPAGRLAPVGEAPGQAPGGPP